MKFKRNIEHCLKDAGISTIDLKEILEDYLKEKKDKTLRTIIAKRILYLIDR